MNDKTIELIRDLASKLGTTSDHLWSVLLRQAPVYAMSHTIILMIGIIITAYLIRSLIKISKGDDNADFKGPIVAIAALVFFIMVLVGFIINFDDIINAWFNPEYFALNQILAGIHVK